MSEVPASRHPRFRATISTTPCVGMAWTMIATPGRSFPAAIRSSGRTMPALRCGSFRRSSGSRSTCRASPSRRRAPCRPAYPDLRHYTLRDYGNRVGIFRIMKALDAHRIRASVAVNGAVAVRYPSLIGECTRRGWEVVGNGRDMDHLHHAGLAPADEKILVDETLAILREASSQPVRGWLSPAKSESPATLDLLASAGIDYVCDWVNDDMPYPIRGGGREIHAMPHPIDIDDHTILVQNHHTEQDFTDQLCDQFDMLYREISRPGRSRDGDIAAPVGDRTALPDRRAGSRARTHHAPRRHLGGHRRRDPRCLEAPAGLNIASRTRRPAQGLRASARSFHTSWRRSNPSTISKRSMKRIPENAEPSSQ